MPKMNWFNGRPQFPGLFWWYDGKESRPIEVDFQLGKLYFWNMGSDEDWDIEELGDGWHCPIVPPEPPQ